VLHRGQDGGDGRLLGAAADLGRKEIVNRAGVRPPSEASATQNRIGRDLSICQLIVAMSLKADRSTRVEMARSTNNPSKPSTLTCDRHIGTKPA
jgi:hypothetical protein